MLAEGASNHKLLLNFTINNKSSNTANIITVLGLTWNPSNDNLYCTRPPWPVSITVPTSETVLEERVAKTQVLVTSTTLHCSKLVQGEEFSSDITKLLNNKNLSSKSKLLCLALFIDQERVLRVGGRLRHSSFTNDKKYPILLPKQHHITKLIAKYLHVTNLHVGPQTLLTIMRQKYWPLSGKNLCKQIVHSSIVCFKAKPKFHSPLMGQLSSARVTPSRPFTSTGIDFCGPVYIRQSKNKRACKLKTYIAIFVCITIKAVHLELVNDLTARSLTELHEWVIKNKEKIAQICLPDSIEWHFIPPNAPHMGGLWEAYVKSVKYHLYRVMGTECLTFEEVATLLSQIEACLNSRPINSQSNDPNDERPLTPAHFVVGDSIFLPIEQDNVDTQMNKLQRWTRVQLMVQSFWKRWSNDYIISLQQRGKWKRKCPNINIGDLVIIKKNNIPPSHWMVGRIILLHSGTDRVVRVATVKTAQTTLKRPVVKLSKVPIE
ncbi:hypothetical protein QTP88_012729 [Uroleucon formosanum]